MGITQLYTGVLNQANASQGAIASQTDFANAGVFEAGTGGAIVIGRPVLGAAVLRLRQSGVGGTVDNFNIQTDGTHSWGAGGAAALDTTLARLGAGQLRANGSLGQFGVTGPAAKPATPVVLADVIAALQAYGMVT